MRYFKCIPRICCINCISAHRVFINFGAVINNTGTYMNMWIPSHCNDNVVMTYNKQAWKLECSTNL